MSEFLNTVWDWRRCDGGGMRKVNGRNGYMNHKDMVKAALEYGFTNAKVIGAGELVFDPELRVYCEENSCGNYGKKSCLSSRLWDAGGDEGTDNEI